MWGTNRYKPTYKHRTFNGRRFDRIRTVSTKREAKRIQRFFKSNYYNSRITRSRKGYHVWRTPSKRMKKRKYPQYPATNRKMDGKNWQHYTRALSKRKAKAFAKVIRKGTKYKRPKRARVVKYRGKYYVYTNPRKRKHTR